MQCRANNSLLKFEDSAVAFGSIATAQVRTFAGITQPCGHCYLRRRIQFRLCPSGRYSCRVVCGIASLWIDKHRMRRETSSRTRVMPDNRFERTMGHRGPRLAAPSASWPVAQLAHDLETAQVLDDRQANSRSAPMTCWAAPVKCI